MTPTPVYDLSPLRPFSRSQSVDIAERAFALACGVRVSVKTQPCDPQRFDRLLQQLDHQRGCAFSCGVDAAGRYRRQRIAFVNPPLAVTIRQRAVEIAALNARGRGLLAALARALPMAQSTGAETEQRLLLIAPVQDHQGSEETRTRRPSVIGVLRQIMAALATPDDGLLGLYGAFGYDLAFALEDIPRHLSRAGDQRDLVLYLPDRLVRHDPASGLAEDIRYDFAFEQHDSAGLAREGSFAPLPSKDSAVLRADHGQGDYAAQVERAQKLFARGDLFELVLSQTFARPTDLAPSEVYKALIAANPAPYEALMNLGEGEHLVSASPEMFVRVEQRQGGMVVETCPISGTIRRGSNAIGDSENILTLLESAKDHAELTMCTDVDRNDKARVCQPGSVTVGGRRMIEVYSRLIHTVDHVQGLLRPEMDALDAFLTHTWAVTVTGAPKLHAMRQVEAMERSPRRWYGGAFGALRCDGSLETGLTLRTVRMAGGCAEVRVGATLLADSDPDAEHEECVLKASALMAILEPPAASKVQAQQAKPGIGQRLLLVDHEDSFVLTLADYLRQTGAEVSTLRPAAARAELESHPQGYDLVVLSPGPGRPADFGLSETLALAEQAQLPVFGVCLGLQGIVEYFGGSLRQLSVPMHGKASTIAHDQQGLFARLPSPLSVGRYHSLAADRLPSELQVTARSEDGTVMAIAHRSRPLWAVQFHPESILSAESNHGVEMIRSVLELVSVAQCQRSPTQTPSYALA